MMNIDFDWSKACYLGSYFYGTHVFGLDHGAVMVLKHGSFSLPDNIKHPIVIHGRPYDVLAMKPMQLQAQLLQPTENFAQQTTTVNVETLSAKMETLYILVTQNQESM